MDNKRIVYACDTPLQVLNAINLHEQSFSDYQGNIFIYNQFGNAEQIVKKLQESNVFEQVFLVERYKEYHGIKQKLVTIKRMIFPYMTLKKYVRQKEVLKKMKYDYVAFSFITTFSITVFGLCKKGKFLQIEDGIGTYIGDILNDYTTGMFKKIVSMTSYKHILHPERVCVYNPKMYDGGVEVHQLNANFSKGGKQTTEKTFEYKENSIYKDYKIIYLSQPLQEVKGYNQLSQDNINKVLEIYKNKMIVRMHPRDTNILSGYNIDCIKNLWELECIHQIENDNILLGGFSTAQLMPKVLNDKEPYIVFLYKLNMDNYDDKYWKEIDVFVDKFKKFYQQPEKIFIPKTIKELKIILKDITKIGESNE